MTNSKLLINLVIISGVLLPMSLKSAYPQEVKTGIANSGQMTIEGNVSIEVISGVKLDDLIALLSIRAKKVEDYLKKHHPPDKSKEFIKVFRNLHREHIKHLRAGNVIAAHEVLIQIHDFSYNAAGFRTGMYICARPYYIRGSIIGGYLVDEFEMEPDSYPLSSEELSINFIRNGCGPIPLMAKPWSAEIVYKKLGQYIKK